MISPLLETPHMSTHTIVTAEINAWKAEPIISCRYSYEKKPLLRKRDLRFLGKLESARAIFPELAPAVKDFIILISFFYLSVVRLKQIDFEETC